MVSFLKKKTILLTGGGGYLGSNLVKRLCLQGANVLVLKRKATNLERLNVPNIKITCFNIEDVCLKEIFSLHIPDVIVHCATNYGSENTNIEELIDSNIILPLKIIEAILAQQKAIPFINTDTILDSRINAYSLSKKQFVEWLEFYSAFIPCINIKLEHFYGPLDNRSKFCTKIILDLINKVESLELTPGMQKRDFIFIEDVIDAFERLIAYSLKVDKGLHHFQLGSGKNITIRNFVSLIKSLTKNTNTILNFGAHDYRTHEIMEYPSDLSALSALGWKPFHNLTEGLIKTINIEKHFLQGNKKL